MSIDKTTNNEQTQQKSVPQKPSFFRVVVAVLAGVIGVNSSKNRESDFNTKSATPFIVGGIVFTLLFMLSLYALVSFVLAK